MKKVKLIALISILVLAIIVTVLILIKPDKPGKKNNDDPEETKQKVYTDLLNNITISAFHPLSYPELLTQEQFDLAANAGIDIMEYCGGMSVTDTISMKKALQYAANAGILANVYDDRISENIINLSHEEIFKVFDEYKGLPGLGGYFLIDEPQSPHAYADLINKLKIYDRTAQAFLNNFPDIWGDGTYQDRLSDFCHLIVDKEGFVLSFDNYPFGAAKGSVDENALFKHFNAVRLAGLENDVRTGFYAQSISYGYRKLNGDELLYHINSALSYGFKAIKYFAWGTPNQNLFPGFGPAVIDHTGKPTDLYYNIVDINKYVHTIGTTLVKLDAVEIYHGGAKSNSTQYEKIPAGYFIQSNDYVIVSRMVHKETGRNYIMVVNKDMTNKQSIELTFTGVDFLKEVSQETGELVNVSYSDGKFTRELDPGAAVLLALHEGKQFGTPKQTVESDNLLADAYPIASGSDGSNGWYVNRINDGIYTSEKSSKGWRDAIHATKWIQFDLRSKKEFNRIDLYPAGTGTQFGVYFPQNIKILISDNGKDWTEVFNKKNIDKPTTEIPVYKFNKVSTRYIRLEFESTLGDKFPCELAEIELFNDNGSIPMPGGTSYEEEIVTPDTNIALNKPVVDYSSNYETPQWRNSINFLTDGLKDTNWASDINAGHTTQDAVEYLTIDLQRAYNVYKVIVSPHFDYASTQKFVANTFPEKYQVQVSTDGVNFTTVATYDEVMTDAKAVEHTFTPVSARYIRIYMTRISSTAIIANNFYVQLSEIEVYAQISDKNALKAEINRWTGVNLDFYTDASIAAFNSALANAKTVLNASKSTDADYKAAYNTLRNAGNGLTEIDLGTNVALNKEVIAENSYKAPEGIFDKSYLTDGLNPPAQIVYETHNGWSVNPNSNISQDTPVDVTIDLGSSHVVKAIKIYPAKYDPSMFPNSFELYTSVDGQVWQLVGSTTDAENVGRDDVFRYKVDNVVARYVKIHITKHSDISFGAFISQLGEAEVFGYEQP